MSILFLREVLRLRFTKNIKNYLKYCVVMFGIKKNILLVLAFGKNQEDQAICATFSSVILSLHSKVPTSLCFSNFRTELLGSRSFWRYCAFALIAIAKWKRESAIAKKN